MAEQARTSRGIGKEASFEALFSTYHRDVLAYCARRASRADAWDAASEVFVVAWRRSANVPPIDEARGWLLGVAYRILANQRRATARRRKLTERVRGAGETAPALPDAQLIRNEEEAEVIAALGKLRPVDREILQLALPGGDRCAWVVWWP